MAAHTVESASTPALEAGRWREAERTLRLELAEHETPDRLLGLGEALWWLGRTALSVEYYKRAYVEFRRAGDSDKAAWAALWLALTYGSDFGNAAAFGGWLGRAERVLGSSSPNTMQGRLLLVKAYGTGDPLRSRELTERTLGLAHEAHDFDLELCALAHLGKILVASARVDEGLALVDEAMAGAFGGERNRLDTVVFTSCSMIDACELAADLERATQWCGIVDGFIREYGSPFLRAQCRIGYGGILAAAGRWLEAEGQLVLAIDLTKDSYPPLHALALARLADLRLNQGRLEEAGALLEGLDVDASGGLPIAGLQLAAGNPALAAGLLERRLAFLEGRPVESASALALLVEAYLATGDLASAGLAEARLAELSDRHGNDLIQAHAAGARASLLVAGNELEEAIGLLELALDRYSRLPLPLEAARSHLALANLLSRRQASVAVAEARKALAIFERLGAAPDADAAAALLRSLGAVGRSPARRPGLLTDREAQVLRLVGLGLSNPEIAARLSITKKTAAHHVSSILSKLGLRNRAQAAAYSALTRGEPVGPSAAVQAD